MHEMGHATMAWACCGKVTSITVQKNESGLTNYTYTRPCVRYWITPAGYLGSSVIGAGLIIAGANKLGSLIASGILAGILLISLYFQKNIIPRILTIVIVLVVLGLYLLHFVGPDKTADGTRIFCTFMGVMNALYSVWDIYDDTVDREAQGSDAMECAKIMDCPNSSRTVGVIWMSISFVLFVGAVVVHIYIVQPFKET